jgi:S1-C subfamily serine protease
MENVKDSPDLLAALSDGMAEAVEKVSESVVRVNGRRRRPASGVVYARNAVLTASHVLEREEDLSVVTADGRTLPAQFVGRDPSSDLAVLSVEGLDVEAAAPAEGEPRIGQLALAVGSPGRGEGSRASLGVVSSVGGPMRTWRGPLGRAARRCAGERAWDHDHWPGTGRGARDPRGSRLARREDYR